MSPFADRRVFSAMVFSALALFARSAAAHAAAGPVHVVGVDTSRYPQLRVTVTAPTGSAAPTLREDDAPVADLSAVNLGKNKSVVLAVDRSESMRGRSLAAAIAAARAFVAAKAPTDQVEVITFGHVAQQLTSFGTSSADADTALRSVRPDTVAGTALWDAVALASRRLAAVRQPGHVLIVLTDGSDVSSSATLEAAVAAANRARASVYTIGIAGPDFTPAPLQQLAAATGGAYHQASSTAQLQEIYASIGRVLSHAWELSYLTTARPGDDVRLLAAVPGSRSKPRTFAMSGVAGSAVTAAPGLLPASSWRSPLAPFAVAGIVGLLMLAACAFWLSARQGRWVRTRLAPHLGRVNSVRRARRRRRRRDFFRHVFTATELTLSRLAQFRRLQGMIERADLPLRAAELIYIAGGMAIVTALIAAAALSSPLLVLLLVGAVAALPFGYVKFKAGSRIKAFDNQLPDLLITIAASLKAGHSFRHAIQSVVDEGAQPSAKEFTRVLSETQLGRPMDDALTEMASRVGSKNLKFVVTAVTIQRQVGGSLAGLFDMVAETVRQRQQFVRKVRGLTAMGRMSAYVLVGLPFFIGGAVTIMNPSYMSPLYDTSTGHVLIGIGLSMIAFGTLLLKRIVSFKG